MTASGSNPILTALKMRGPQTAQQLAQRLDLTGEAVRQQLARLGSARLVEHEDVRGAVGRPRRVWRLSETGHARFPDAHSHLTLELLQSVEAEFGEKGLERLIRRRERESLAAYEHAMTKAGSLRERVAALAEIRSSEGYMAEWLEEDGNTFLLLENHCPICAAATACQGLCRSELNMFRKVLGPGARVHRTEHIPIGARRCAYRIESAD